MACAGYDGMAAIAEALKKTGGSVDPDKFVAALKGMRLMSPRGPIMIDPETRDIVQTVYIRRVEKSRRPALQHRVRQVSGRQGSGEAELGRAILGSDRSDPERRLQLRRKERLRPSAGGGKRPARMRSAGTRRASSGWPRCRTATDRRRSSSRARRSSSGIHGSGKNDAVMSAARARLRILASSNALNRFIASQRSRS